MLEAVHDRKLKNQQPRLSYILIASMTLDKSLYLPVSSSVKQERWPIWSQSFSQKQKLCDLWVTHVLPSLGLALSERWYFCKFLAPSSLPDVMNIPHLWLSNPGSSHLSWQPSCWCVHSQEALPLSPSVFTCPFFRYLLCDRLGKSNKLIRAITTQIASSYFPHRGT